MYYYRDRQDFEAVKQQYKHDRVVDEINRTKTHIFEVVKNLEEYIESCCKQLEVIAATKIIQYVYFHRRTEYNTNHVKYEVGVKNSPKVERGSQYEWTEEDTGKVFGGREKRVARAYAEELAKKFHCEIRG